MSGTEAYSETYSADDIKKVASRFGADLVMLSQSSEAMDATRVADAIEDIKAFAKNEYIERVSVVLADAAGKQLKARKYEVSTDASLWTTERPGDNIWPKTPSGAISVVIHYSDAWDALGDVAKSNFKGKLKMPWGPSDVDTNFPGMSGTVARRYASKAYGMERTDFE